MLSKGVLMKSNDATQKYNDKKIIIFGFASSIAVNIFLFMNDTARPIGTLQAVICLQIPCYVAMPTMGIGILIKSILRGKVPNHEWGIEQTRDVLIHKNSLFKKTLARLYLLIYYPLLFLVAWAIGSLMFYYSALVITQ